MSLKFTCKIHGDLAFPGACPFCVISSDIKLPKIMSNTPTQDDRPYHPLFTPEQTEDMAREKQLNRYAADANCGNISDACSWRTLLVEELVSLRARVREMESQREI